MLVTYFVSTVELLFWNLINNIQIMKLHYITCWEPAMLSSKNVYILDSEVVSVRSIAHVHMVSVDVSA